MPSRSSVDAMVTAQIAAIAGLSTGIADRAEAVLEHLRLVMNFDAACVTLLEADGRRQPPLLCQGYPATVVEHLHSADFLASVESLGFNRNRTPLRVADLQVPGAELATWAEFMTPAGFHEGIGIPLHSPDRRYLGVLATHTCDRTPVSDDTRDLLADLAPLIARAVDPLRTITALASLVTDAIAGVVLTRSGATAPLHGLPGHRLLASGSPVVAEAAACYADGDSRAAFLTPAQPPDPSGYLRVTMLACPHPSHDLNAVVVLRPPGNLHHLSHREMTILGMLIAGWTPARSANHLGMSLRAVHTVLEHTRVKLGEASTAAAIMRAADLGLYLPPTTPG